MKYDLSHYDIDLPAWLPETERIYSDIYLSLIAKEFGIPEAKVGELGKNLRINGANYLSIKTAAQDFGAWKLRERAISKVGKAAAKLLSDIETLDERSAELFWRPDKLPGFPRATKPGETGPFGHTVRLIERRTGGHAVIYLRKNDIREALTIIQNYAHHALNSVPHSSGGQPTNYALNLWVSNMRRLWTDLLNRRFTFSTLGGVGKSKAFRFFMTVITQLDPSVGETKMQTAVRLEMTAIRLEGKIAKQFQVSKAGKNPL
jgi:hypothetical protein